MNSNPGGGIFRKFEPIEQSPARFDFMPPRNPGGHVSQQKPAPAHRPSKPPRNSGQCEDEYGQDIAPDINPQVVSVRLKRPAERPDCGADGPTSRLTLEPVPVGQVNAVDQGISLEDFPVARRGENVD